MSPTKTPTRTATSGSAPAIAAYAKPAGVQIVDDYYDEAVSRRRHDRHPARLQGDAGAAAGNGVRTIVVETANRFARDLMVQEVGYAMLKERGITLIAADRPDAFLDDTPTAMLIRQILGSVSQFEKAMLVSKLRGARERKRANGHKVEGRKSHAEARPEVVALAKKLRRKRLSSREISAELFALVTRPRAASRSRRSRSRTCWTDPARYVGRNSHIFRGKRSARGIAGLFAGCLGR